MLVFEMLAGYPPFYSEDRMEVTDMRTQCACVPLCACVRVRVFFVCVRAYVYSVRACMCCIYCKYRSFLTKIRTIGAK